MFGFFFFFKNDKFWKLQKGIANEITSVSNWSHRLGMHRLSAWQFSGEPARGSATREIPPSGPRPRPQHGSRCFDFQRPNLVVEAMQVEAVVMAVMAAAVVEAAVTCSTVSPSARA
jgi:hypothetical protein